MASVPKRSQDWMEEEQQIDVALSLQFFRDEESAEG